jgi:hypothetical protein
MSAVLRGRMASGMRPRAHTARVIQMMSATINRIPTIVQIKFLFMSVTVRHRAAQGNAEKAEAA